MNAIKLPATSSQLIGIKSSELATKGVPFSPIGLPKSGVIKFLPNEGDGDIVDFYCQNGIITTMKMGTTFAPVIAVEVNDKLKWIAINSLFAVNADETPRVGAEDMEAAYKSADNHADRLRELLKTTMQVKIADKPVDLVVPKFEDGTLVRNSKGEVVYESVEKPVWVK